MPCIEFSTIEVGLVQKMIIMKPGPEMPSPVATCSHVLLLLLFGLKPLVSFRCNAAGKFVVTATQMLDSMERAPRPTRAEATDVLNAVLDGTDVVMLSGETANGKFPEAAVATMRRICEQAESTLDYKSLYLNMRQLVLKQNMGMSAVESVCSSAVKACVDSKCPLIIALSETGTTARLIAKYRHNLS